MNSQIDDKNRLGLGDNSTDTETDIPNKIKYLENEVNKIKNEYITNYLTVFGIFASIISFILVEAQFISKICDITRLAGLTLVFTAILIIFNLSLIILSKDLSKINDKKKFSWIGGIAIILTVFGVYLLKKGQDEDTCKLKSIDRYIEKEAIKLYDESIKKVDDQYKELDLEFQILKNDIQVIKKGNNNEAN